MTVTITIIGLDALGQSLGLAWQQGGQDMRVIGHDRETARMRAAEEAKAVHESVWNLFDATAEASLIIINEPPHHLRETLAHLAEGIKQEAVLTDTSQHKGSLVAWAKDNLPDNLHFVGSTPLVGATQPDAALFQQQRYAIVTEPTTPEPAVRLLANALGRLGAEPLFMDVAEHDALMAAVFHLPTMIGLGLLQTVAQSNAWRDLVAMAETPYRNATRLPYRDAEALSLLLRQGREPLLHWLDMLEQELGTLRRLVAEDDEGAQLQADLAELLAAQQQWEEPEKSSLEADLKSLVDEASNSSGLKRFFGLRGRTSRR